MSDRECRDRVRDIGGNNYRDGETNRPSMRRDDALRNLRDRRSRERNASLDRRRPRDYVDRSMSPQRHDRREHRGNFHGEVYNSRSQQDFREGRNCGNDGYNGRYKFSRPSDSISPTSQSSRRTEQSSPNMQPYSGTYSGGIIMEATDKEQLLPPSQLGAISPAFNTAIVEPVWHISSHLIESIPKKHILEPSAMSSSSTAVTPMHTNKCDLKPIISMDNTLKQDSDSNEVIFLPKSSMETSPKLRKSRWGRPLLASEPQKQNNDSPQSIHASDQRYEGADASTNTDFVSQAPGLTRSERRLQVEKDALVELIQYLKTKGIAAEALEDWHVVARGEYNFQVFYVSPGGVEYTARGDVRNLLLGSSAALIPDKVEEISRATAHENSRRFLQKEAIGLVGDHPTADPIIKGDLMLISLGTIEPALGYHDHRHVWPPGYRCVKVGIREKTGNAIALTCIILRGRDGPLFRIEVEPESPMDENIIVEGDNEMLAWQEVLQVLEVAGTGRERESILGGCSFFNIAVERLIEGLDGCIELKGYQCVDQRGTGHEVIGRRVPNDYRPPSLLDLKERLEKNWNKDIHKDSRERSKVNESGAPQKRSQRKVSSTAEKILPLKTKSSIKKRNRGGNTTEKYNNSAIKRPSKQDKSSAEAILPAVRKEVETQLRARRKEARSAVLSLFDSYRISQVASKRDETILLKDSSDKPPAPERVQVHPGIIPGVRLEHMMELWKFIQTFSEPLGLRLTPSLDQLSSAIVIVSGAQSEAVNDDIQKEAIALLDNISCSMVRLLVPELHGALGSPCDHLPVEGKSGGNIDVFDLIPVNQLTWPEIARQALLVRLGFEYLQVSLEDIRSWITGGDRHWKAERATNVLLRQRLEHRWNRGTTSVALAPDFTELSAAGLHASNYPEMNVDDKLSERALAQLQSPSAPDEDSEEEDLNIELKIRRDLKKFIEDTEQKEILRRCGAVLLELMRHQSGFFFILEPDHFSMPEYNEVIMRPISMSTIFRRLTGGNYEHADAIDAAASFSSDVRLMFENCWCFNHEGTPPWTAAETLSLVFERVLQEWVLDINRPSLDIIISNKGRPCAACRCSSSADIVLCDRCDSVYHLNCLIPALAEAPKNEWFCPVCVSSKVAVTEYGCASRLLKNPPYLSGSIICDSTEKSQMTHSSTWGIAGAFPQALDWSLNARIWNILDVEDEGRVLHDALRLLCSQSGGSLPGSAFSWTAAERVVVLLALTSLALASPALHQFLAEGEQRCRTLRQKALSGAPISDAAFKNGLRSVGGELAVKYWKKLLAETGDETLLAAATANDDDEELLGPTPGVCTACWGSTFDCDDGTVLICDGCNGEVHVHCSKFRSVPPEDVPFFCQSCTRKLDSKKKIPLRGHEIINALPVTMQFEEPELLLKDRINRECSFKERVVENVLMERQRLSSETIEASAVNAQTRDSVLRKGRCGVCASCSARACGKCSNCKAATAAGGSASTITRRTREVCIKRRCTALTEVPLDWDAIFGQDANGACEYCGMNEQSLCSSLVRGQTVAEMKEYVSMNRKLEARYDDHIVTFRVMSEGEVLKPPPLLLPYLPPIGSSDAKSLCAGPQVHEICAITMVKAFAEQSRHGLRQLREEAVEEAIRLGGFRSDPLGVDRAGRFYTRFAGDSNNLYVYIGKADGYIESKSKRPSPTCIPAGGNIFPDWTVYSHIDDLRLLVEWLNPCIYQENLLRSSILKAFPTISNSLSTMSTIEPQELNSNEQGVRSSIKDELINDEIDDDKHLDVENSSTSPDSEAESSGRILGSENRTEDSIFPPIQGDIELKLQELPECEFPPLEATVDFEDDENSDERTADGAIQFHQRRYYAVAVVGSGMSKSMRLPKALGARITYDIYRDGQLVASENLDRPFSRSDSNYYFRAAQFKRTGNYTLRFAVNASPSATTVDGYDLLLRAPPLSYSVCVSAKNSRTGAAAALNHLRASKLQSRARSNAELRIPCNLDLPYGSDELLALRNALAAIFNALPSGALREVDKGGSESIGIWSPSIRDSWVDQVNCATSCEPLIETLLILEACIDPKWLRSWYRPALAGLPHSGHLLKLSTPGALAQRLFLLDKALHYDRISQVHGRSSAASLNQSLYPEAQSLAVSRPRRGVSKNDGDKVLQQTEQGRQTRTSRAAAARAKRRQRYNDDDFLTNSDDMESSDGDWKGGKRVSRRTRNRLRVSYRDPEETVDDQDEYPKPDQSNIRPSRARRKRQSDSDETASVGDEDDDESDHFDKWVCNRCTNRNSFDSKRCSACNSLRPANSSSRGAQSARMQFSKRLRKSRRRYNDEYNSSESDALEYASQSPENITASSSFDKNIEPSEHEILLDGEDVSRFNPETEEEINQLTVHDAIWRRGARAALTSSLNCDFSLPFLYPVSAKDYPDYPRVVTKPMDLSTMSIKLRQGYYDGSAHGLFLQDAQQIRINCERYNSKRIKISASARRLEAMLQRLYRNWCNIQQPPTAPMRDDLCAACGLDDEAGELGVCMSCNASHHAFCIDDVSGIVERRSCPECMDESA